MSAVGDAMRAALKALDYDAEVLEAHPLSSEERRVAVVCGMKIVALQRELDAERAARKADAAELSRLRAEVAAARTLAWMFEQDDEDDETTREEIVAYRTIRAANEAAERGEVTR